jgi:hypothetical protein
MERLTAEEKARNLEEYRKTIHPKRDGEPLVRVRVVVPPGFWYGPSPNAMKLYTEGEELTVPEHIFLNSDYHTTRKSATGSVIRGVLERADVPRQADGIKAASDDLKALIERNKELERMLQVATGSAPTPLVVVDKQEEEI